MSLTSTNRTSNTGIHSHFFLETIRTWRRLASSLWLASIVNQGVNKKGWNITSLLHLARYCHRQAILCTPEGAGQVVWTICGSVKVKNMYLTRSHVCAILKNRLACQRLLFPYCFTASPMPTWTRLFRLLFSPRCQLETNKQDPSLLDLTGFDSLSILLRQRHTAAYKNTWRAPSRVQRQNRQPGCSGAFWKSHIHLMQPGAFERPTWELRGRPLRVNHQH